MQRSAPLVIMCVGNPSTGKTSSTQRLHFQLSNSHEVALLTTMSVRKSLGLMDDLHSDESRERVYSEIVNQADANLSQNAQVVILDGNFNKRNRREAIYGLLDKHGADLVVVECRVDDVAEIQDRLRFRQRNEGSIENRASTMDLYNLIKNTADPLHEDLLPDGTHPKIIEYDTSRQAISCKNCTSDDAVGMSRIQTICDCLMSDASCDASKDVSTDIKAVIFDIGGVLQSLRWEIVSNRLSEMKSDITMDDFRNALYYEKERYFGKYEVNVLSHEMFWSMIVQRLGLPETSIARVSAAFKYLYGPVDSEMETLVADLKRSYKLYILSNSCPELEEAVRRGDRIYDNFDEIYFSHRIGFKKPDERAFNYVLTKNGLKPGECIFIDDVSRNTSAAKQVGMHGVLFLSPGKLRSNLSPYLT